MTKSIKSRAAFGGAMMQEDVEKAIIWRGFGVRLLRRREDEKLVWTTAKDEMRR